MFGLSQARRVFPVQPRRFGGSYGLNACLSANCAAMAWSYFVTLKPPHRVIRSSGT